jgi:hypothetical protein
MKKNKFINNLAKKIKISANLYFGAFKNHIKPICIYKIL